DAAIALATALALSRGDPLGDDDDPALDPVRARLHDLHLQLLAARLGVEVRAGRAGDVLGELEQLRAAHPLREDLAALQMTALVQVGRPAEALAAYETTRAFLADTLGSDPSPALQATHLEVLRNAGPTSGGRTTLPAALTSFVGRDLDAARVDDLLRDGAGGARLVTVVGPGGSGKTRLAQEVAAGWLPRARDGVWFAELAPVADADDIALAVLDGIGVRDVALLEQRAGERPQQREARTRVLQTLQDSQCLVVVDNCEHVVAAAADLVAEVLAQCPGVRVIATSREPLGVDGEQLYPLTPLAVPDASSSPDPAALADVPSVRLLLDRARSAGAPLELDATTADDVVRVVRRLDGLPLAIELAAARLRSLTVHEVADRLADRFRLLTGGKRTAVPRHRTLRAVVEWSWDLLDPVEREVAEHFCVFGSGATAVAVQAVCPTWRSTTGQLDGGADVDSQVVDVLHALVDKSILVASADRTGSRFRMLETLREYGAERLAAEGTLDAARDAHARYHAALASAADRRLRGPEQLAALHVLDVERDNVLAALGYLGDAGDAVAAVDLAVRLAWYWLLRENGRDAARWLRFATAVPGAERSPLHAVAEAMDLVTSLAVAPEGLQPDRELLASDDYQRRLVEVAQRLPGEELHQIVPVLQLVLMFFAGRRDDATALMERGLASSDPWVRAAARSVRLAFAENVGDVELVRADLPVALAEWEQLGDHWGLASTLGGRGQLRTMDGDLAGAADDLEAARGHLRLLGGAGDDFMVTVRLADLRLRAGDVDGAQRYLDELEQRRPRSGRVADMSAVMVGLAAAGVAEARGDAAEVARRYDEVLGRVEAFGEPGPFEAHGAAWAYAFLGLVDLDRGDLDRARTHVVEAYRVALMTEDLPIIATAGTSSAALALVLGRVQEAAVVLGASAALRGSPDLTQPRVARLVRELREGLGDKGFEAAFAQGQSLAPDAATARVDPAPFAGGEGGGGVERERPVAQARRR
ncbi:ATP-binding protein, partial [Angustibacter peucedani]